MISAQGLSPQGRLKDLVIIFAQTIGEKIATEHPRSISIPRAFLKVDIVASLARSMRLLRSTNQIMSSVLLISDNRLPISFSIGVLDAIFQLALMEE
jgi:hypothetical protein